MNKQELRKIYLQKRLALTEGEYLGFSRNLCDLFFSCVDLSFVKVLHTFLPITKKKEPNTWLIIDRIRREFPHIQISISRANTEKSAMENFNFEGLHQIQENEWGIPEPLQGIPTTPEKIDMVLVPLLAFDKNGDRVGYGKGYYDRFLALCRADCKTIGLSFFPPVDLIEDANSFDKKLEAVVTAAQFYQFRE